jgi:hypothetical protein
MVLSISYSRRKRGERYRWKKLGVREREREEQCLGRRDRCML